MPFLIAIGLAPDVTACHKEMQDKCCPPNFIKLYPLYVHSGNQDAVLHGLENLSLNPVFSSAYSPKTPHCYSKGNAIKRYKRDSVIIHQVQCLAIKHLQVQCIARDLNSKARRDAKFQANPDGESSPGGHT